MKKWTAFAALGVVLLSVAASWAQSTNPNMVYQKSLLLRSEYADEKNFCTTKVGVESPANQTQYTRCKVTRFFVDDILSNRPSKNVPPMFDASYVRDEEANKVADAIGG